MATFLQRLKFAWGYFVRGRHRASPVAVPPDFSYPPPDPQLMGFMVDMYRAHGAETVRAGNWVCINRGRAFTRAAYFDIQQHPKNLILQTNFITVTKDGIHIAEAFAGIGTDLSSALRDACQGYQDSTFHALFGQPCDHVEREKWMVNGISRNITMGMLRIRGVLLHELWPPVFEGIQSHVQNFPLTGGLHWCRYFYASHPVEPPTIEVLLDNETCEPLQSQAAELPWPKAEGYYFIRLFFTIQDSPGS